MSPNKTHNTHLLWATQQKQQFLASNKHVGMTVTACRNEYKSNRTKLAQLVEHKHIC